MSGPTVIRGLPEVYVTRLELAERLHVSPKTIQRLEREGMPSERWGRRLIRYRIDRVEDWLKARAA